MKLASSKAGRDGRLLVVSRDLTRAADASGIAPTLQAALDNWDRHSPRLEERSESLERDEFPSQPFDQSACAAPLPRAYQWIDGSAYVNHVELVRKARGADMPASFWTDPLMYQVNSDSFLAPHSPIPLADEAWGLDFEAELAVITGDVAMGVKPEAAQQSILLLCLSTTCRCVTSFPVRSPRVSAFCIPSLRRPCLRSSLLPMSWATPGMEKRSSFRCCPISMSVHLGGRMPAPI